MDLTTGQQRGARPEGRRQPAHHRSEQRVRRPEQQQRAAGSATTSRAPGLGRTIVTRLIWTEVTRLLSRRFTGIALIMLLLGLAGSQLVLNDALRPLSGEQLATSERAYQQDA